MKYKSFREQLKECVKNGNLVKIYFSGEDVTGIVCKKHMKQCSGKVCEDERGVTAERKRRKKRGRGNE